MIYSNLLPPAIKESSIVSKGQKEILLNILQFEDGLAMSDLEKVMKQSKQTLFLTGSQTCKWLVATSSVISSPSGILSQTLECLAKLSRTTLGILMSSMESAYSCFNLKTI
jgi:hypothetical protein